MTLCAHDRMCIFGVIDQMKMRLSAIGEIVASCWKQIPQHFPVLLDEWVVMPNHMHAIIVMRDGPDRVEPVKRPLGVIIGAFKAAATKRVNALHGERASPLWQRNFYEHVMRNEADLGRVRQYIVDNPIRWADDPENPNVIAGGNHPFA
ncbi:MAG TPA: transposase [Xanthobacteraceae bacterium]